MSRLTGPARAGLGALSTVNVREVLAMRSSRRPVLLVLAAPAVLLSTGCAGDPVAPPPPSTLAEAPLVSTHGPVAVTEVLDLGEPTAGGPFDFLRAVAINERGQVGVFGIAPPGQTALLWEAGAFRALVTAGPPAPRAFVTALTDAEVGAGHVETPDGPGVRGRLHAAIFAGGAPWLLPDGPGDVTASGATGANAAGDVVGFRVVRVPGVPFPVSRATLWRRGGAEVVDLGALTATASSRALAVNSRGHAVGVSTPGDAAASRPVFFAEGRVIDLGVPPGYTGGEAVAVNERGQAAGHVFGPAVASRAAFWDQGGRVVLLDVPPGARFSVARGINDAGDVVGTFTPAPGAPTGDQAAFWRGGALTVLPALPRQPDASGVPSVSASDVNNRGQVVGGSSSAGGDRAVRWTVSPAAPVPDDPPGPNRAPAVVGLRPDPFRDSYSIAANACGGRFTACVRFTVTDPDGDADAPFRVVVDWGDGAPWAPNELARSGVPALAPHDYAAPGTYTVRVTATDRRGAAAAATLTLAVVP